VKTNQQPRSIALIGCGTVGSSVANFFLKQKRIIHDKLNLDLRLKYIIDLDLSKAKKAGFNQELFNHDYRIALEDDEISMVVELIGGVKKAKQIIEESIMAGKHVITANKALLAHHGNELFALARKYNVCISFEASCGGGIPIIRALYDGLIANQIDALFGIVNGTCNYILTAMTQEAKSYAQSLKEAQATGLAELDPTLDVSGTDSAHKLAILAALAFKQKINFESIPIQGIDTLELCDIEYGSELGYVVKLLAIAYRLDNGISLCVQPAFISKRHPLAWVSGPFNAISVYGHATGHTMYYGRGAGGQATASAVMADIISVALGTAQIYFNKLNIWPDKSVQKQNLPVKDIVSRFYIRVMAVDKPGVLAKIADILGRYKISISSVLQKERALQNDSKQGVPVVITTHQALSETVSKALEQVDVLDVITGKSVCIGIIDEHPE
jgi:homoserine dehydrogenase